MWPPSPPTHILRMAGLVTPVSFLWQTWKCRSDPVLHIDLRRWADLMLVAPLDANTLGKVASGICDNLLVSDLLVSVLSSFAPSLLSCRFHCTKKSVTMGVGCQAAPLLLWDAGLLSPLCSCLFSKEAEDLGPVDHLALQLVSGCVHFLLPPVVSRAPWPQPSALPSSSLTGCLPSACTSIDFPAFTASLSVPPSHQNLETHRNTLRRVLLPQESHILISL